MMSRLWSLCEPKPLTRFEASRELSQFASNIQEVRDKTAAFALAVQDPKADEIVHKKYAVMNAITDKLNAMIDEFNLDPRGESEVDELRAAIRLTKSLHEFIDDILCDERVSLNTPRNENSLAMNRVTTVGTAGGLLAAGVTMAAPVAITAIGVLLLTRPLSGKVQDLMGIDTSKTATVDILERLRGALSSTNIVLNARYNKLRKTPPLIAQANTEPVFEMPPDPTICMLTKTLMQDPVVCRLDGRTYERKAITAWLIEKYTSPFNHAPIPANTRIADILTPDYAMQELIGQRRSPSI